jgi:hypothetical protein
MRFVLAIRFDTDVWPALLHPLAMAVLVGSLANSMRWVVAGGGSRWKGRSYDVRNPEMVQRTGPGTSSAHE